MTRSNIGKQDFSANLKSPLVRCLALLMSTVTRNDIRGIYQQLQFYISDVDSDIRLLCSQGILVKSKSYSSRFYYSDIYTVNIEYVSDIIAGIPQADFKSCLKVYNLHFEAALLATAQREFATAVYDFLSSGKLAEGGFEGCKDFFSYVTGKTDSCVYRIVSWMLLSDRLTSFFMNFDSKVRIYLAKIAIEPYERMSAIDTDLHNQYLFFSKDTPVDPTYSIVYVLQNELMADGHLDDLIARYADWPEVDVFLRAVKSVYEKDYMPIYTLFLGYLDRKWVYPFEVPHFVLFLAGALIMDKSDTAAKLALKLSKKREIKSSCHLLSAILSWKNTGAIPQKLIDNLSATYYNPATHVVFTLFAIHCHFFPVKSQEPYYIAYYVKNIMTTSAMKYMRLLYAEEGADGADASTVELLRKATGMTSFLSGGGRVEKWQTWLESIQAQLRASAGTSAAKSSSRIAYLVTPGNLYVRPILQKSTAGGSWTKGRHIALKSFREGIVDGMTARDSKVAAAVRVEQTWSGVSYYMNSRQAIAALAGNPCIFTDDDSRLKIDIFSQPLELSVEKDGKGNFSFRFNVVPDEIENNLYIDSSNSYSIRVVELSDRQMKLMHQLLTFGKLPAKAAPMLGDTLALLGSEMTVMSDLVKQSKDVRVTEGSSLMVVQLIPDGEFIDAHVFAKPLGEYPPYLTPGEGSEFVSSRVGNETVQTRRDLAAENANFNTVLQIMQTRSGNQVDDASWHLTVAEALDVLSDIYAIPDKASVEWPEGVRMKVTRQPLAPGDFHIKVRNVENWFEVEGKVDIGEGVSMKVSDILGQMQQSATPKFIRLNETDYVRLTDQLSKMLRQISQTAQQGRGRQVRMSQFNALSLDQLEKAGVDVKGDRAYRHMLKLIETADSAVIRTPRGLEADLREYQKEGFRWMARLRMWGAGACLADDMGLGKTLQAIALLLSLRNDGPSLVVAPASVLTNWKDEITRFAPALRPVVLNNAADAARSEIISGAAKGDIVITSYGLLVTKEEELSAVQWNVAVLDEAHTIKNRGTKMSKSAMKLNASMRVALTGTPIQNRLAEIWNIFQFLNPGLLGSFESFTDRFINPIERDGNKDRQRALKRLISPFLLRRTKNDVLSELPEKSEITLRIDLSEEERALYERLRREAEVSVAEGDGSAMMMLAQLTRLRQAACDPHLIYPDIRMESSKAVAFMELVNDLIANNHRALVFSQFTSHLDLIKARLDKAGISYLYLDGATPQAQRARLVAEFQGGDTPLFLISLKAGGLGLNLTGADYVIHLDPWWNPAIEDQASDRSYRMGQEKPVTVYRLIAAGTIEEKILRLHKFKQSLADALLEGSDMSARLTKDDILELLKEK